MTTSPAVLAEYRRIRTAQPLIGAKNALLWARSTVTPRLPEGVVEVDESRGEQTVLAKGAVDGFDVEIYARPDYDSEPRGTYTDTWSEHAVRPHRWTFGGLDEYGQPRRDRDSYQWFVPEHGETQRSMAEGWHRSGMSKSNAWLLAGQALRDDARLAGDDRQVYAVTASVSRQGIVLGEDSLWGCDVDPQEPWSRQRGYLLDVGDDVLSEALHAARESLSALVASV